MQKLFHTIGSAVITGLLAIGSLFSPAHAPVGATIPVSTAVFQTSLASSIAAADTSMTLVNGTNSAGNALSGYTCFNIDEGTSLEEFTCGTATGTSVTSLVRGIDPVDGDLAVTALKKGHRRGASVKITDYPSIAILSRILNGDETAPNAIKYAGSNTCANPSELCPKSYVDGVVVAGGVDASDTTKGISKLSIAPASSTNPISVGDNDTRVPSQGENDALIGTSGTPSSSNKFVTNADTSATSVASAVYRLTAGGKIDATLLAGSLPAINGSSLTGVTTSIAAGTQLFSSNNTSRSESGTSYVKHKGITVYKPGIYTASFTLSRSGSVGTVFGRIYVNGIAVGTERTETNGPTTFTENFTLVAGDEIEVYTKTGGGGSSAVLTNFQLYVERWDGSTNSFDA